jgi:hypothetical protein
MKLEVFEKIITLIKQHSERSFKLAEMGVDLINYEDAYSGAITLLFNAYYGSDGEDWISWYLYERESFSGEILQARDKDGNEICYDIPSLWKYVEELRCADDFVEYELPEKKQIDENFIINLIGGFFNGEGQK